MPPKTKIHFSSQEIPFPFRGKTQTANWLQDIARKHKRKIGTLNYIFVTDESLLSLNKQFLNHNTLTDIISFDYSADEPKGTVSGEIYISIDRVHENAEKFNTSKKDELARVMAHGLLHLCGFRDKSETEKKQMRKQEENALALRKLK